MALPDRPDEAQLRRRARDLQRAARAGEPEAVARLQAHGIDPAATGLRRAQHVLAREHGHGSWPELLAAVSAEGGRTGGEGRSPWDRAAPAPRPPLLEPPVEAASELARRLGSRVLDCGHLVLVATDPERAGHVELAGLDRDWLADWVERILGGGPTGGGRSRSTTVMFEEQLTLAAGLCLAEGRSTVTPADLGAAGLYAGFGPPLWVDSGGLDADVVIDGLPESHRLAVYPAHLDPPRPPWGDMVYYPSGSPGVTQELSRRYPPGGTARWGVNSSSWKPGFHWVFGDDDIPLLDVVRSVLADPTLATAVPWREAHRLESEARAQVAPDGQPKAGTARRPSWPTAHATVDSPPPPTPGTVAAHRAEARELLVAMWEEDPQARSRILAAHPLYVGRDPGRLDPAMLRLADAYAVVAAEAGFGSWPELVAEAERTQLGAARRRWAGNRSAQAINQAMSLAARRGDPGLRPAHIVLALAQADGSDQAIEVLGRLGVTVASVTEGLGPGGDPDATTHLGSTPTWHALTGWAAGLALGRGADRVEPPDVLLALAYGLAPGDLAAEAGVDPDAVHDALAELGHPVPPAPPSEIWLPAGP